MTTLSLANRRASPITSTKGNIDPIQLHATAHNALSMAMLYAARGNAAAAMRKIGQAASALRQLDTLEA